MKDSVKYIIGKYGNDRAKYHIIQHPDDCSSQSNEIRFNNPHVNEDALIDAVEDLQMGNVDVPWLLKDLRKVDKVFYWNTFKIDEEKVRSSSSSL